MTTESSDSPGCVLIVDRGHDARDVLTTALERRGVETFWAGEPRQGLSLVRQLRPAVIVWDQDSVPPQEADGERLRSAASGEDSYLVVLGGGHAAQADSDRAPVVPKPYHFGPLIRTIEQLVERAQGRS